MSKETKIGLLVSLGVILVFAMILSLKLSGDGQPVATNETAGSDMTKIGGDVIDQQANGTANQPAGQGGTVANVAGQPAPAGREESGTLVAGDVALADPAPPPTGRTNDLMGPPAPQHLAGYRPLPAHDGLREALPAPAPARQEYVVQKGDTLAKIADKVYGAGQGATKWRDIAAANPGVNPTRLRVNSKLVIPALAARTDNTAHDRLGGTEVGGARTYTVAAGDSLGTISQKVYGTSKNWKLIQKANANVKPTALKVGMKLTIPAAPGERPAAPVEPAGFPATQMAGTVAGSSAAASDYAPLTHLDAGPVAAADSAAASGSATAAVGPLSATTPSAATAADTVSDEAFNRALDGARDFVSAYADSQPHGGTYKVVPGDTLGGISQKLFGTSKHWQEIYALNRDKLPRPAALRPGMELRVPAVTRTASADSDTWVAAADLPR